VYIIHALNIITYLLIKIERLLYQNNFGRINIFSIIFVFILTILFLQSVLF